MIMGTWKKKSRWGNISIDYIELICKTFNFECVYRDVVENLERLILIYNEPEKKAQIVAISWVGYKRGCYDMLVFRNDCFDQNNQNEFVKRINNMNMMKLVSLLNQFAPMPAAIVNQFIKNSLKAFNPWVSGSLELSGKIIAIFFEIRDGNNMVATFVSQDLDCRMTTMHEKNISRSQLSQLEEKLKECSLIVC